MLIRSLLFLLAILTGVSAAQASRSAAHVPSEIGSPQIGEKYVSIAGQRRHHCIARPAKFLITEYSLAAQKSDHCGAQIRHIFIPATHCSDRLRE
jgi:hypothetical protein